MTSFARITCLGVSHSFGRKRALSNVDLVIEAKEITSLIGPNGAGKTTLISILSTLLSPSRGEVRYGDLSHGEAAARLRGRIGLLSHSGLVYPDLSALENLRFTAGLYNLHDAPKRAAELLKEVSLPEEAWRRPARTYSRGMVQRLSLARALLPDPDLLLLDEPFSGLDSEATARLFNILKELRNRGRMVVLVTHDLSIAAALSDKVAFLTGGRLMGPIEQGLDEPALKALYDEHLSTGQPSSSNLLELGGS